MDGVEVNPVEGQGVIVVREVVLPAKVYRHRRHEFVVAKQVIHVRHAEVNLADVRL